MHPRTLALASIVTAAGAVTVGTVAEAGNSMVEDCGKLCPQVPVLKVRGGQVPDLLDEPVWESEVEGSDLDLEIEILDQDGTQFDAEIDGDQLADLLEDLGADDIEELDDVELDGTVTPAGKLSMVGKLSGDASGTLQIKGDWSVATAPGTLDGTVTVNGFKVEGHPTSAAWDSVSSW